MIAVGAWSLFPAVKVMVTQASNGMVMATQSKASSITGKNPGSYFAIGLLLGVAYSPCAGPALGFATSLALQGNNIGYSLMVMFLFAVGASLGLAFIALTARRFIPTLARVFEKAQVIGGSLLIAYGVLVLAELDTVLIGMLLSIWPESLVNWSTLF